MLNLAFPKKRTPPLLVSGELSRLAAGHDARPEQVRIPGKTIHVSSMDSICPRQLALAERYSTKDTTNPTSGDRILWATGNALADMVKESIIASIGRENVWGKWENDRVGWGEKASKAPYQECTLEMPEIGLCGNADLILCINGSIVPVEMKTSKADVFDALTAPTPDHVMQVSRYSYILRRACYSKAMGAPISTKAIVYYIRKEYQYGNGVYKDFVIDATERDDLIDSNIKDIHTAREAQKSGILPDRLAVCNKPTATRAKKCPNCIACFSQR